MGTTEITCGVTAPAGGRARVEGEMTQTASATSRNLLVQLNIEYCNSNSKALRCNCCCRHCYLALWCSLLSCDQPQCSKCTA